MADAGDRDEESAAEVTDQIIELLGPVDSPVYARYIDAVANHRLRRYRSIVQWGAKEGQTYYSHVLDGITTLERLRALEQFTLTDREVQCLFLAYTVHDINKIPPYNTRQAYADVASPGNIREELERLEVDAFFAGWRDYLTDIVALAQLHQAHLTVTLAGMDRRQPSRIGQARIHQLGLLIKAVDLLALSDTLDEQKHKAQFLQHLNAACPRTRYRFITHRLSEHRGLLSNVIHNAVVEHLQERYPGCVALLYYADGVAYLLPMDRELVLSGEDVTAVADRVARRLAELQGEQLGQFIKARPFGIAVDAAAIESGATAADLLGTIYGIVARKRYTAEREDQREAAIRSDLQGALEGGKLAPGVVAQVASLVETPELLSRDEERLRLGDYVTGFRNLINDHSAALGVAVKDAWIYTYQVLGLPIENYPVYDVVNSFRRGYFIVRDLPLVLAAVDRLHEACLQALDSPPQDAATSGNNDKTLAHSLSEYLNRMLLVSPAARTSDFGVYLRQYVTGQNHQCCNCSSLLPTQEWMTANAPPSIGVQSFSNRLAGGALHEPKRQICPICRAQFILERISWAGHTSKQGLPKARANGTKSPGYTTFYLYLYPRTYFTEPFLRAWWAEVERLRSLDAGAFLIDIAATYRHWAAGAGMGDILIHPTKMNGVALPRLDEAVRNVPILPINAPGQNYGEQFILALEKAVLLRRFFDCRVVLSRLPTPPVESESVRAIFVDGLPRNLLWLVAGSGSGAAYEHEADLTYDQAENLQARLELLHRLQDLLRVPGDDRELVHDLAVAAGDEEMRLWWMLDREIERKAGTESKGGKKAKGGKAMTPEMRATTLSREVAPIARDLVRVGKATARIDMY